MPSMRRTPSGSVEMRVIHRTLLKPFYSTHDNEAAAERYWLALKPVLDRGEVPADLQAPTPAGRQTPASVMLSQYLRNVKLAPSDQPLVAWLRDHLSVTAEGITVRWTDAWIADMKGRQHLAPGSIRKRVESLARALDWWHRQRQEQGQPLPSNPLRTLPRGYSTYKDGEAPAGREARVDARRDRRLGEGEPERIEATILGAKRPDRQRSLDMPERGEMLLLWRLIVNTALRLREAYRLRRRDLRFDLRTIHVSRSKTGPARDVPMTREVHDLLAATGLPSDPSALIFPFWDGSAESLASTSSRLSMRFASIFRYAGCDGLTEHDLRHEATCRWMLMRDPSGRWLFRPEEVRRITGHKSVQQFERYLSLRGSDLAERLW